MSWGKGVWPECGIGWRKNGNGKSPREQMAQVLEFCKNYAKQFNYSLNKVQETLTNAGMKDYDGDGFLEFKNGEEITKVDLNFLVYSGSTIKVNAAKLV